MIIFYCTFIDQCVDTDNGAFDYYGESCDAYWEDPELCSWNYGDDDFDPYSMCCACQNTPEAPPSLNGKII